MATWRVYCGHNKQAVVLATPTLFTSDAHNNEISVRCHKLPGDLQSYNTTILQNKTNTNPICVQFAGSHIDLLYCVLCSVFFLCQVSKYICSSPACQEWNIDQISFWRQTPSNVFQACANFSSDFLRRYRWLDARHPPVPVKVWRMFRLAACRGAARGSCSHWRHSIVGASQALLSGHSGGSGGHHHLSQWCSVKSSPFSTDSSPSRAPQSRY